MSDALWTSFDERVSVEDRLRVAVTPLDTGADATSLTRLAERNVATLGSIAALEERRVDGEDDNPVMQELARLDGKLNALVDIVSRVLLPAGGLPPREPVRFNAVGITLPATLLPVAPDVCVRIHMDVCPGLPLELPATVERRFDDGRAFLSFQSPGEVLADALERLVFRVHRRKIAEARHSLT